MKDLFKTISNISLGSTCKYDALSRLWHSLLLLVVVAYIKDLGYNYLWWKTIETLFLMAKFDRQPAVPYI